MRHHDPALASGALELHLGSALGPRGRVCPQCAHLLIEHEWTEENVVRVDLCPGCAGVWLDAGELNRIRAGPRLEEARAGIRRELTEYQAGAQLEEALAEARVEIRRERTGANWLFQFLTGMPVEFNFRPRRLAAVTLALIAVNVCFFLVQISTSAPEHLLDRLALHPAQAFGARWWLGLVTHNFLHANLIHLVGNLYFFWILGDNVEDVLGRGNFLLFCAGAALISGLFETVFAYAPGIPTVGFSGVVSAVLLSYAVLFRHARLTFMLLIFQWKVSVVWYAGIWLCFNLLGLVMKQGAVSFLGHLGGASFGLAFALLARDRLMRRDPLLRLLNGVRSRTPA